MSVPPPHRRVLKDVPISERGLTQLREWLKGPKDIPLPEVLYYVHPVAPASTPPDHRLAEPHPAFENSWGNISNSDLATAFGVGRIGTGRGAKEQLFIQLAVTGGEGVPGSTIFTLPERFWPLKDRRIVVAMGTDGLGVGVVKVQASDGAVVFLGMVASGGDGTDETGELRFDVANEGGYLQVGVTDFVKFLLGASAEFSILDSSSGTILDVVEGGDTDVRVAGELDMRAVGALQLSSTGAGIDLFSETDMTITTDTGADLSVLVRRDWLNDIRRNAEFDIDGTNTWNVGGVSDYNYSDNVTEEIATGKTHIFKDGSGNPILTLTG